MGAAPSTSGTTRTADVCASADSRETATASAARGMTISAHGTSATIVTETACASAGTLATGAGFAVAVSLLRSATTSTRPAVKTRIVCRVVSTLVPSVARIKELASTRGLQRGRYAQRRADCIFDRISEAVVSRD